MFLRFFKRGESTEGSRYEQALLVKKLNQQRDVCQPLLDGICSTLANLYIKAASKNRDRLLERIDNTIGAKGLVPTLSLKQIKKFINKIYDTENSYTILLNDRNCYDSFVFAAKDKTALLNKLEQIITHLQSLQKKMSIHGSFANIHSFVIEQDITDTGYGYYFYDANNPNKPQRLTTVTEILNEMESMFKRIQQSIFYVPGLHRIDEKTLFTFYVYPTDVKHYHDELIDEIEDKLNQEMITLYGTKQTNTDFVYDSSFNRHRINLLPGNAKRAIVLHDGSFGLYLSMVDKKFNSVHTIDYDVDKDKLTALMNAKLLEDLQLKIPDKIVLKEKLVLEDLHALKKIFGCDIIRPKESQSLSDLNFAQSLLQKYRQKYISRGVLLSNLSMVMAQNPNFDNLVATIQYELNKHLLSIDLLYDDDLIADTYFDYLKSCKVGKTTLLHDAAEIDDANFIQYLLKYLHPLVDDYSHYYPIERAIATGNLLTVKIMLDYLLINEHKLDLSKLKLMAHRYHRMLRYELDHSIKSDIEQIDLLLKRMTNKR